jgi:choline monooxygenase
MFVHQNRLETLLKPDHYRSEAQYRREIERLFVPAWHLVGTSAELPRDGDFLTLDLLGEPALVRNIGGEYHAFQNVCTHRHSLLTHQERGNSPRLRCQYHGWEYKPDGFTARIPDAHCFRPFDRENSRLRKFRLERCGDLLFVSLAEDGPSLREHLEPYYDLVAGRFTSPAWRPDLGWGFDSACNWKFPIENTLESYHIPCLHPNSFGGIYPSEERQEHTLDDRYTTLTYDSGEDPRLRFWQRMITRRLGGESTNIYIHCHIHPNLVFVLTDLYCYAGSYLPTSPGSTRLRLRSYRFHGPRRGPVPALLSQFAGRIGRWTMLRVMSEDIAIFEDQQKGMAASRHPGCIGTREERIFIFQQYILRECADIRDNGQPLP